VALTGLSVAEYFRDVEGKDVLLFIDNIFRFTQRVRECRRCSAYSQRRGLPADPGDRDGQSAGTHHLHHKGSITSVQAIYVPADDLTDGARHFLRPFGRHHRAVARHRLAGHLPGSGPAGLDLAHSRPQVIGEEHYIVARRVQEVLHRTRR